MESTDRSFTVIDIRRPGAKKTRSSVGEGGRFVSKTPFGAARKAFTRACREKKVKGTCKLVVTVQETTRGENGKVFAYKMKREKLAEPREISRGGGLFGGGTPITIEYSISGVATDVPKDI